MVFVRFVLLFYLCFAVPAGAATVYLCDGDDGVRLYQDTPCEFGGSRIELLVAEPDPADVARQIREQQAIRQQLDRIDQQRARQRAAERARAAEQLRLQQALERQAAEYEARLERARRRSRIYYPVHRRHPHPHPAHLPACRPGMAGCVQGPRKHHHRRGYGFQITIGKQPGSGVPKH